MKIKIFALSMALIGALSAKDSLKESLQSVDSKIANAAIESCVSKGTEILPQLRKWAIDSDPRLKARARTALGKLTGQWASQTDLIWHRDFDKAVARAQKEKKPLMVLQLFGSFDEEFC